MSVLKFLPPKVRDAIIVAAMAAVLIAVVRPALVTAQGTVNSTLCIQNVRQLDTAISGYTQDYDEVLPPFTPPSLLATKIQPYTTTSVAYLLTCPLTQLPYVLDTSIGGKSLSSLPHGDASFIATDSTPHADGKLTVGFLNGTVTYGGVDVTVSTDPNAQCVTNAKQVGLALLEYTQDYGETLPVYHNLSDLETALQPYTRSNNAIFTCPETGLPFIINKSLSGKNLVQIASPATVKFIQDARPHPNGDITEGFLDGHVVQAGQ